MKEEKLKRLKAIFLAKLTAQFTYFANEDKRPEEKQDIYDLKHKKDIENISGSNVMCDEVLINSMEALANLLKLADSLQNIVVIKNGEVLKDSSPQGNIFTSSLSASIYDFCFKLSSAIIPMQKDSFIIKDSKDKAGVTTYDAEFEINENDYLNTQLMSLTPVISTFFQIPSIDIEKKEELLNEIKLKLMDFIKNEYRGNYKQAISESIFTEGAAGRYEIYDGKERLSMNKKTNDDMDDFVEMLKKI